MPAASKCFAYPDPDLILTQDAWVYGDRNDNPGACSQWEEKGMTLDMYLLARNLLHEYTHWDWFLDSVHNGEVIDQHKGYGWEDARALDKSPAIFNANSYGWYATENFWTVICKKNGGYDALADEEQ